MGAAWRRAGSQLALHRAPSSWCKISQQVWCKYVWWAREQEWSWGNKLMLCFATALFLLLVKSQDTKIRCLNTSDYPTVWSVGSAGASWTSQLLEGWPWLFGRRGIAPPLPSLAYILSMCSILKVKACNCSEQEKAASYKEQAAPVCLQLCHHYRSVLLCLFPHSPSCTTFLFCNQVTCFPPPPLKAYMSPYLLFCFCSFPPCYTSLNQCFPSHSCLSTFLACKGHQLGSYKVMSETEKYCNQ